jgi:hypothetical protein
LAMGRRSGSSRLALKSEAATAARSGSSFMIRGS